MGTSQQEGAGLGGGVEHMWAARALHQVLDWSLESGGLALPQSPPEPFAFHLNSGLIGLTCWGNAQSPDVPCGIAAVRPPAQPQLLCFFSPLTQPCLSPWALVCLCEACLELGGSVLSGAGRRILLCDPRSPAWSSRGRDRSREAQRLRLFF